MEKADKKPLPPYLSFTTLTNFIEGLGVNMPTRIDKSLMKSMSGAAQSALISALDYLGLKKGDKPTDALVGLASAQGDERAKQWDSLIRNSYGFLFTDGFDLGRATQGELDERFRTQGVSGSTIGKCVSFFTAAAQVAGITLSPHFKQIKSRAPRTSRGSGAAKPKRNKPDQKNEGDQQNQQQQFHAKFAQLHPSLEHWIAEIPANGEDWKREDFDGWLSIFTSMVERLYKIPSKPKTPV
jgi:hypothetical protein